MKRKTIVRVITLAITSLAVIIISELMWVNKVTDIQKNEVAIQDNQVKILKIQFDQNVTIALTNVRDKLLQSTKSPDAYLEPVRQITNHYYVVSISDTLNRLLLQQDLVEEFKQRNILEDFEYGIYDCFADSIIFDKYVGLGLSNIDTLSDSISEPHQKWDYDGHYFGVYFPNRKEITTVRTTSLSIWLLISSIIMLIVVVFFGYAISVILKQKRLSEIKTDFINNMTHELKTPISTILLSSEVLMQPETGKDTERIARYAKIIYDENQRLKNQVERVLQLATLDKETINIKNDTIDIHDIINKSVGSFGLILINRNGECKLNLNAKNSIITGDGVHITNIIYNLIDNAIKYSPQNPIVLITTTNKNNGVDISICDNGIGIPKEYIHNIFQKFFRVPTGNVHNVKGFGLGLYYVKHIVNKHKGTVTAKNNDNQGCTFTIWLPVIINS